MGVKGGVYNHLAILLIYCSYTAHKRPYCTNMYVWFPLVQVTCDPTKRVPFEFHLSSIRISSKREELCINVQGITGCSNCGECAQCLYSQVQYSTGTALCFSTSEIYGATDPRKLPAPTTSNLSAAIVTYIAADRLEYAALSTRDAERCIGLPANYTLLPRDNAVLSQTTAVQERARRFGCVGNGFHGEVRAHYCSFYCSSFLKL